jgi:hypothetical protein
MASAFFTPWSIRSHDGEQCRQIQRPSARRSYSRVRDTPHPAASAGNSHAVRRIYLRSALRVAHVRTASGVCSGGRCR